MRDIWDKSERTCPRCGERFYICGRDWGWKFGKKKLCSYHCMRELERERDNAPKGRGRPRKVEVVGC